MTPQIQFVKAYAAGVSASDRDFVERVRVHILPAEPITFETVNGAEITVGGPDLVPIYFETLEAHRHTRGSTYIPQLVEHDGPAVGALASYEIDDLGIWAVVDLWAEGVEARKGRDFVSAFWQFSDFGDDGRPRAAAAHEVSFTPIPQFARAQTPVEALELNEDSPQVAATISVAAYLPSPEGNMTPEEMAAALLGSDEFRAAIANMVAEAIEANAAEPEAEEAEEVAAMDGEGEEAEEVAASMLKVLEALNAKIDRVDKSTQVAAGLRGQRIAPAAMGGPTPGADYITKRLDAGISLSDALAENAALSKGA